MKFVEIRTMDTQPLKRLAQELTAKGLDVAGPVPARVSKIKHLKIGAEIDKIKNIVASLGGVVNTNNKPNLSGTYQSFTIDFPEDYDDQTLAGQSLPALSRFKSGRKVRIKELTPVNFGLGGVTTTRSKLISFLKNKIPQAGKDPTIEKFLVELVSVAAGEKSKVDPEVMEAVDSNDIRQTGIDFGEILTPIMLCDESDQITFPAGNSELADVEINGDPVSVKSASGSGTSFKAIKDAMEKFKAGVEDESIPLDADEKQAHTFFRAFLDTEGSNIDKIIAASQAANTPEHQALEKVVGKKDFSFGDLVSFADSYDDYGTFLKEIYPVSIAGNYGKNKDKPNGMPMDHKYYMGLTDKKPVAKSAGKPSWDANKGKAGANILVYVLGTSFLADAKTITKATKYSGLIKKILGNVKASLAKIDILDDGSIKIYKKPFSDLDYEFQYHAPSHIPGNNLPGFSMILD